MEKPVVFSSFLVKVASRCNLDCDYCYVYHHADQSWRSMPNLLSSEHREKFIDRLAEYVSQVDLKECTIILHGGEPLLAGVKTLAEFANQIRSSIPIKCHISIQTNGVLLTAKALSILMSSDVSISLSLDGPREANDKHRLTKKGMSSFDKTEKALELLNENKSIFAGVISVIDVTTPPGAIFEYFDKLDISKIDFLLPDAHWTSLPPNRSLKPDVYKDWLTEAFDLWLEEFSHIEVRTFEALLDCIAGESSSTDAFGFGDVTLLSIETDGSYHDLDVLKVTSDGATKLAGNVSDTKISDVAMSQQIMKHRAHLTKQGLCSACQNCEVVDICGGGALPHRFDGESLLNPTIYCYEMKSLISHAQNRLAEFLSKQKESKLPVNEIPATFDLKDFDKAESSKEIMLWLQEQSETRNLRILKAALEVYKDNPASYSLLQQSITNLTAIARQPGTVAWSNAVVSKEQGSEIYSVDGLKISPDDGYIDYLSTYDERLTVKGLYVGQNDRWLRIGFGTAVCFNSKPPIKKEITLIKEALNIIERWRPDLASELYSACSAVQFVTDQSADPDKIVSFSDNSVPGALYVSIFQGDEYIDPIDLADSLIHEHRHQKLYLLEQQTTLIQPSSDLVISPWREDLRPPSGLLHAIFVFVELRRFWIHVAKTGPNRSRTRAVNQLIDTEHNLKQAFKTIKDCSLTDAGRRLVSFLEDGFKQDTPKLAGELCFA